MLKNNQNTAIGFKGKRTWPSKTGVQHNILLLFNTWCIENNNMIIKGFTILIKNT